MWLALTPIGSIHQNFGPIRSTIADHILGYLAQNAISSAPNPPAPTHFWWFPPLKIALTDAWTSVPRPVGCGKPMEVAQRGGCQNGSTRSTGCRKFLFPTMILNHMQCQNKCFWRVLSSWWPVLALLKSQNALKMGCFGAKNGSNMGQKCVFPKMNLDYLGCLNK